MKAADIRAKSNEELETLTKELRTELFKARIQNHTNNLNSTARLGQLRRDIARVATIVRERETTAKGA